MALADITTTTGNTYSFRDSFPGRVVRQDVTNGSIQEPKLLETAHTAGSAKRASRSLAKLSRTIIDGDGVPKNMSVHVVITRDVTSAITNTNVSDCVAEMADLLADSTFLTSFLKGGHL